MKKCLYKFLMLGLVISLLYLFNENYNQNLLLNYKLRAEHLISILEEYKLKNGNYPENLKNILIRYDISNNEMYIVKEPKLSGRGNVDYAFYSENNSYFLTIGDYYPPNLTYRSDSKYFEYNDNTLD
ncbi:hypothetical protein A4G20_04015 [Pasteurellaceae bacterium RH1A]|nr:hypothetical protein A4G20_04015 [Pasteurellaceae bacterium RH1A]